MCRSSCTLWRPERLLPERMLEHGWGQRPRRPCTPEPLVPGRTHPRLQPTCPLPRSSDLGSTAPGLVRQRPKETLPRQGALDPQPGQREQAGNPQPTQTPPHSRESESVDGCPDGAGPRPLLEVFEAQGQGQAELDQRPPRPPWGLPATPPHSRGLQLGPACPAIPMATSHPLPVPPRS